MDLYSLSEETARILAPFLPTLLAGGRSLGEKALDEIGKQTGGALWGKGKELWEKIEHQIASHPEKREELSKIASTQNIDSRTDELRLFLAQLMEHDPRTQVQIAKTIQNLSHNSNFTINVS